MHELLATDSINSENLEMLLKAREKGEADFLLVDVREDMEYEAGHLKGVDMLKPTSSFQNWAEQLFNEAKDKTIIFTCRTGARSGQVQHVFKSNGHERVINHAGGIVSYRGEIER
ncbi:rhodanese-like domain-containing protein [Sulfurovum sp.]|uniref:rhodanese-like domain-containing protein n=1 Tax=Sulfurovum sp. TaxID=1969726 RepID=UPI0025F2CACC|nr:rhodanese-like domain-containing protein [Sulfurovum sp.]